ncbi:Phosphotransferase enzyme family protein [Catalinimonas alkaloidigena]|uniref:Phosphotransferase enzyme family protein n=1 Tax=Catalinimonas alkaloidigena TaxID=1075417 RepID=A0A1G9VJ80_9BACT|nr:phosphotransferase [Catalinimonas alkaloidigena]SDM72147.1 Phosphotransferase enzyme family protein [Catalinimonas alkaloidigena]
MQRKEQMSQNLQDTLRALIETALPPDLNRKTPRFHMRAGGSSIAQEIAAELVRQAVASGLPLRNPIIAKKQLSGGNTAEIVEQLTLHAPFVFKLDSAKPKLAEEGRMMYNIHNNPKLPDRFKQAWPIIYAIRDQAPFAYIMEYFPRQDGWISLEDRLFPSAGQLPASPAEAVRCMHAVLDILFLGYQASKATRALPNLLEDYVARISERLAAAADKDSRFESRPLRINGEEFKPWKNYVGQLADNTSFLDSITPRFTTIAHGDPNPGNVLLRLDLDRIEVKLIDPKEWETGDYLFDVAKLTHFILATGPIEKLTLSGPTEFKVTDFDTLTDFTYQFEVPQWANDVVAACLDRVRQFAADNNDDYWQARYELAMASNLLGLPVGRLEKGRSHAAIALYGEGLRWLKKFCSRLPTAPAYAKRELVIVSSSEVEPDSLAEARDRIRTDVPQVVPAVDKRGFQTLHWLPKRTNANKKTVELSLEHEARLTATSEDALGFLKEQLSKSIAMRTGNTLLPDHQTFGRLTVRRVPRAPNAQSIDRYWELKDSASERRMTPRMMSLRERIKTSAFMTWETSEEQRALNLELPFVSYEQSAVIARLEFNWIDDLQLSIAEFVAGETGITDNPLILSARIAGIEGKKFEQVLEHTTFREKYLLHEDEREVFQLNIDHVIAQSLKTQRLAAYTDIDIAPSVLVNGHVLASLIAFSRALANRYNLTNVSATKVWRDALLTGEL